MVGEKVRVVMYPDESGLFGKFVIVVLLSSSQRCGRVMCVHVLSSFVLFWKEILIYEDRSLGVVVVKEVYEEKWPGSPSRAGSNFSSVKSVSSFAFLFSVYR